jgi:hypothetical protein
LNESPNKVFFAKGSPSSRTSRSAIRAAECQAAFFLIDPPTKKQEKKRFNGENYSSIVPNYKLALLMKLITQNLNKTARQRVPGPQPRVLVNQRPGKRRGEVDEAWGSGGLYVILFIGKVSM